MRLIDADALKHVLCDECEFHTTLCREKAECDTVSAIDAQPTVDAIPVEYIQKRIANLDEMIDYEINEEGDWNGQALHGLSELKNLLREWRQEQGILETTRNEGRP